MGGLGSAHGKLGISYLHPLILVDSDGGAGLVLTPVAAGGEGERREGGQSRQQHTATKVTNRHAQAGHDSTARLKRVYMQGLKTGLGSKLVCTPPRREVDFW